MEKYKHELDEFIAVMFVIVDNIEQTKTKELSMTTYQSKALHFCKTYLENYNKD